MNKHSRRIITNRFLSLLAAVVVFAIAEPALAQIKAAKVTGGSVEGVVADDVSSFKGIPFAAPPVGQLRWKSPQPVIPWAGIKKVDTLAPGCMQDKGLQTFMNASTTFRL